MKGIMHERISAAAVTCLPAEEQAYWNPVMDSLLKASNYPDNYFGQTEPNPKFAETNPDWMDYAVIHRPDGTVFNCHRPEREDDVHQMFTCYLEEAEKNIRSGNPDRAARFLGCVSHLFGDQAQPAHQMDEKIASDLFMQGNVCGIYHTVIESIDGEIPAQTHRAVSAAADIAQLVWSAEQKMRILAKKARAQVPVLFYALERHDPEAAARSAGFTGGVCACELADVMHTAYELAHDRKPAQTWFDLCDTLPSESYNDSWQNRDILIDRIFSNDIYNPLKPDLGDGKKYRSIAMLPDVCPMIRRTRQAWADYPLPAGEFKRFTAVAGLCRGTKNEVGLAFEVWLDGKLAFSVKAEPDDPPKTISVDLGNATMLRLRVADVREDSFNTKFYAPIWCNPRLEF